MSKKIKWHLTSAEISTFVYAEDQFAAYDTIRDLPAEDFGMIVQAEPDENMEPFPVRTSLLMFRWGREADALRFIARGMELGMPDTTREDRKAKVTHG
jgi:hypothetical protein